ncbi:hypothetical protein QE375_003665 [Microbacterium foliorum]|uniref:Uncharacterized protein n=1 Tax=Microbacterium foliorum TaxID=104336 RepID=A0ABU1HVL9_9MICO|nr:hypothetical protein [Microbacterium foliorum]MDR6144111.1 hypothetical protein [Microbacterium foliorum]
MTSDRSFPPLFGDTVPDGPLPSRSSDAPRPAKRRKNKSDKERYQEADALARSLKERLEAKRAQNRDLFIEDLYVHFDVAPIEGDFDDSERIYTLRTRLNKADDRRA